MTGEPDEQEAMMLEIENGLVLDVVQALLVLALLIPPAILFIRQRRRAALAMKGRT